MPSGIETTTGPLGQGISNAVGMAIAERLCRPVRRRPVDHHTYVICSDGDLMEGVCHEALSLAGQLKLAKLIVLYDDNNITIDGSTALAVPRSDRSASRPCGWRPSRSTATTCEVIRRATERGGSQRAAEPDRLPHHHRLRPAAQGRHPDGARRRAGRGRHRGGAQDPGLGLSAFRHSRRSAGVKWRAIGVQGRDTAGRLGRKAHKKAAHAKESQEFDDGFRREPARFGLATLRSMPSRKASAAKSPAPAPANSRKKPWM